MSVAEAPAPVGHNKPPEPSPFEAIRAHCDDLYMEAKHWLDGAEVGSEAEAEAVKRLLDEARKAWKAADDARVEENEPFDRGKAAVQEKYAPLIAKTESVTGTMVRMQDACLAALEPWRKKKLAEAEAKAKAIRDEAEAKAKAAAEAMQASAGNLTERETAETLVKDAAFAQREAVRAARAVTTGTGLTTYYEAVLTDRREAMIHYMKEQPGEFVALCQRLAEIDARSGKRSIPGFSVEERKRAR